MPEETSQERTEEATPHRREQAIEKGDVVHSREIVTAAVVFAAVMCIPLVQGLFISTGERAFHAFFRFHEFAVTDVAGLRLVLLQMTAIMAPILIPVFAIVMVVGVAANVAQVGWVVSSKKLEMKPERLSPAKGFERLFGRRSIAEAVRTLAKFLIVGLVSYVTVRARFDDLLQLNAVAVQDFIPLLGSLLWSLAWRVAVLMGVFAVFDYGYQRWDWSRRLRMSRQELKEEIKEREGNPLVKQRIRALQSEQARRRMMADVPKATAVIVNPTHCAVALRYEPGKDRAPTVVAKGVEHLARKIREVAEEHKIPIVEEKPLAWALYRTVKIGKEIPASLFQAVAEVLAHVFRLSGRERMERLRRQLKPSKSAEPRTDA